MSFVQGKTPSQIVCGDTFCFLLTSDNTFISWGLNSFGQLGDGTSTTRYTPVLVSMSNIQNRTISIIQGSTASSYAVTTDGILYAWGMLIYKLITVRLQWVWQLGQFKLC